MTIEILGVGIDDALKALKIHAEKQCSCVDTEDTYYDVLTIDGTNIDVMKAKKWLTGEGQWSDDNDSGRGDVNKRILVNDKPILAWSTTKDWFPDVLSYVHHIGANKFCDIAATLADLAKQNNLSLSVLIKEYGHCK